MKSLLLFLLFQLTAFSAIYNIPVVNRDNWTPGQVDGTGVTGGIPRYFSGSGHSDERPGTSGLLIDVTQAPYNMDKTGVVSISTAFSAAADAAALVPGSVLFFPAGTYLIGGEAQLLATHDNITIRGEGPGITVFKIPVYDGTAHSGFTAYNGGTMGSNIATVTGTKTVGTKTVQVDTTSGLSINDIVNIIYSNEEDNTRIQGGAIPTWTQKGYPNMQQVSDVITNIQSGPPRITLRHGLPSDGTYRTVTVVNRDALNGQYLTGVGFEDFSIEPGTDGGDVSFSIGISMYRMQDSWVHNVHARRSQDRCIYMNESINCEISKCSFKETVGYSSDGLIGLSMSRKCIIENNIFSDGNICIYDDGNSSGNLISYNYSYNVADFYLGHNAHPTHALLEGNDSTNIKIDGYHGNSSAHTFFRNRLDAIIVNRFSRRHAAVGNILGKDGTPVLEYRWSMGNPSMGNGEATGFAGPSGLSSAAGTFDYKQVGYGFYEYQIQPGDIFAGDFWRDWQLTGVISSVAGDGLSCVVTMDSSVGGLYVGQGLYNNGPTLWWNSRSNYRNNTDIAAITGLNVSLISSAYAFGDTFPTVGTPVLMWAATFGFQERDLDVEVFTEKASNYFSENPGPGTIRNNITPDTLPNSFAYSTQPSWWTDNGFSGTWPPVNPYSPNFATVIIPAAERYFGSLPLPQRIFNKKQVRRNLLLGR